MQFEQLVTTINDTHTQLSRQASRAVNLSLTLRNWLIGRYIVEYELDGADRATYGDGFIAKLAERLNVLPACSRRQLSLYSQFYRVYPEIWRSVTAKSSEALDVSADVSEMIRLLSAPSTTLVLLKQLSFTHFETLLSLNDPLKRCFYEIEAVRGGWSVRELKRQIGSLYFERMGLSRDHEALSRLANQHAEINTPRLTIKDPYVFEFLELSPQDVMAESRLEDILLSRLQAFLLELGHGFCFEARQKRILIGDEYYFVDLVFYNRVLKCHVLVELKVDQFRHEHLGQLNTYVNWYKKHQITPGDNPPIGLLLCTQKHKTLMEYALAGMDNSLFVSRYQLEMPSPEQIASFLQEHLREETGE